MVTSQKTASAALARSTMSEPHTFTAVTVRVKTSRMP